MAALAHKEPDRVPIAELKISPLVYKKLMPEARDEGDFSANFGLDVVRANATYNQKLLDVNTFRDEWNIVYRSLDDGDSMHPVGHPVREGDSLNRLELPSTDIPERFGLLAEYCRRYKYQKAVGFAMRAGFLWASALMGTAELLYAMAANADFVHSLLDLLFRRQTELATTAVRNGADIIFETDDYAYNSGPLFSPEMFSRFISPHLREFTAAVHAVGGIVIKHTDGNINQLLDLLVDCGIDGIHSLDPGAGMKIKDVKQKYGQKISLWGNIDCGNLLCLGSRQEIIQAVRECIRDAAPGGGFVLTSANSITGKVPPENYAAMLRAGRRFGQYEKINTIISGDN